MKTSTFRSVDPALETAVRTALRDGRRLKDAWTIYGSALPPGIFLDTWNIDGVDTAVMGCVYEKRVPFPSEIEPFHELVHRGFFRHTAPPEAPEAGFIFSPILHASKEGLRHVDGSTPIDPIDVSRLRSADDWTVLRLDIPGFYHPMMFRWAAQLMHRIAPVSTYLLVHPDLFEPVPSPADGMATGGFGYAFIPLPVRPSLRGYGPGHFKAGLKTFTFVLTNEGYIDMTMKMILSPRSEKLLDIKGFDPIYGLIDGLDRLLPRRLTFGQRAHDWIDRRLLKVHDRIHEVAFSGIFPQ